MKQKAIIDDIDIIRKSFDYLIPEDYVEICKKDFDYVCSFMNYRRSAYSDVLVYRQVGTGFVFGLYDDRNEKYYIPKENILGMPGR